MDHPEKKYNYEGRLWSWKELDEFIDRKRGEIENEPSGRHFCALSMVEGKDILDIGCNVCIYSSFLVEKGHNVVAVDVDETALEIARKKHSYPNLKILKTDGQKLDFEDNFFDSVLLLEVLEHSQDPRGLVQEIHRVIKPGGFLILSVPNAASYHTVGRTLLLDIKSYFRKIESWPEFATDQRDHYFYWDPFTIYRLLNRQGFKYVDHRFVDNFKWVNFLARFIPPFRRISTCFIIKVQKTA